MSSRPPFVEPTVERPFVGIGLMILALGVFSVMDGIGKGLTQHYHPVAIIWGRYLFTLLCLLPFLATTRRPWRTQWPKLQFVRGLCMIASSVFFISGLQVLPLADCASIAFVSPLIVTALSIPFLGEKVGIRRWSAIGVGLVGVIVIMRPGTSVFQPAGLLPFASAMVWSMGLVITRMMRGSDGVLTTLAYSTAVGVLVSSIVVWPFLTAPSGGAIAIVALLGAMAALGQVFLIRAFRYAPASLLAPFSYSQIVWATSIGYFAFGTLPDAFTWTGTAILIASGLYTLHRERIRRRLAQLQAEASAG